MKNLFYVSLMLITLSFITSCEKDENTPPPGEDIIVTNVQLPSSTTPSVPGEEIKISGKGFTAKSEIWFRSASVSASIGKSTGSSIQEVKAEVKSYTETDITVVAPEVYGNQTVVLKQDSKVQTLGTLKFEEEPVITPIPEPFTLYSIKQESPEEGRTHSIVGINPITGESKVIQNIEIEGQVYDFTFLPEKQLFVILIKQDGDKPSLLKLATLTGETKTLTLSSAQYQLFTNDGSNIYAIDYMEYTLVKIDLTTGKEEIFRQLVSGKIPDPLAFNPETREIYGNINTGSASYLKIISLDTTTDSEILLDEGIGIDYRGLVLGNEELYCFKTISGEKSIVKIDIPGNAQELITTVDFTSTYYRSLVFDSGRNSIIGLIDSGKSILKVDVINKKYEIISLTQNNDISFIGLATNK